MQPITRTGKPGPPYHLLGSASSHGREVARGSVAGPELQTNKQTVGPQWRIGGGNGTPLPLPGCDTRSCGTRSRQWVRAGAPRAPPAGAHADAAGAFTDDRRSHRRGRDNGDRVGADPRTTGVCECAVIGRRGRCSMCQAHHAMRNMKDAKCNMQRESQCAAIIANRTGCHRQRAACTTQHAAVGIQSAKRATCNGDDNMQKQTTRNSMQHRQDARCNADQMQHAALQHATRKPRNKAWKQATSTQSEYRCEYPRVPQSTRDSGGAFGRRAQRRKAVQRGLFNVCVSGCAPQKACTCTCTRKAALPSRTACMAHARRLLVAVLAERFGSREGGGRREGYQVRLALAAVRLRWCAPLQSPSQRQ
jgi:hypothetical protein